MLENTRSLLKKTVLRALKLNIVFRKKYSDSFTLITVAAAAFCFFSGDLHLPEMSYWSTSQFLTVAVGCIVLVKT